MALASVQLSTAHTCQNVRRRLREFTCELRHEDQEAALKCRRGSKESKKAGIREYLALQLHIHKVPAKILAPSIPYPGSGDMYR